MNPCEVTVHAQEKKKKKKAKRETGKRNNNSIQTLTKDEGKNSYIS